MNNEMLGNIVACADYELKEGTTTSYLDSSDWGPLPRLLSIHRGQDLSRVARTGRGLEPRVGQMKATFTKAENSPYKQNKPYKVQTAIWRVEGSQTFYYGSLGISNKSGKITSDNGDMVVFRTADWRRVRVYVFAGLADPSRLPQNLADAVRFIKEVNP